MPLHYHACACANAQRICYHMRHSFRATIYCVLAFPSPFTDISHPHRVYRIWHYFSYSISHVGGASDLHTISSFIIINIARELSTFASEKKNNRKQISIYACGAVRRAVSLQNFNETAAAASYSAAVAPHALLCVFALRRVRRLAGPPKASLLKIDSFSICRQLYHQRRRRQ